MQANGSEEQVKGMYLTQITEEGDLEGVKIGAGTHQHRKDQRGRYLVWDKRTRRHCVEK